MKEKQVSINIFKWYDLVYFSVLNKEKIISFLMKLFLFLNISYSRLPRLKLEI